MKTLGFKVCLLLLAALFLCGVMAGESSAWVIETVDAPKMFCEGSSRAIAIDKLNRTHMVYGGDNLYYAYFNGTSWQSTVVDNNPNARVGCNANIAIDSNNKVHISYFDYTNFLLKYATNASGSWVITTIGSAGDPGSTIDAPLVGYSSIAVDSNSKVHIVYEWSGIQYATNVGGTWSSVRLGSGYYPSIAIDSNNKVHIAYTGYVYSTGAIYTGAIWYLTNASGNWVEQIVESKGNSSFAWTSIAIGLNGRPRISYYNYPALKLAVLTPTNTWFIQTIDSGADVGQYSSLAIGSDGFPRISYHDGYPNYDLKFATNASGAWVTRVIDGAANANVGLYTSIALDSNNRSHIVYYNDKLNNFKYATNKSGTWVANIFDKAGDVGKYSSIALSSNGKPRIGYYDSNRGDLKFTRLTSTGTWFTQIVDSIGDVGQFTSLAIGSKGPRMSYYDVTNGDLKFAALNTSTGTWSTQTIDSAGDVGQYSSLAIGSDGWPRISYYDKTSGNLKFATNASGAWVTSVVDSLGDVGLNTSIALDSTNNAHIVYLDSGGTNMKYATNARGSWVITTIDTNQWGRSNCSIAIDSNNKVHISYAERLVVDDSYLGNLKYVTNASGSWVTTIVEESNSSYGSFGASSIAIDLNNKIHIGYNAYPTSSSYTTVPRAIKYVTNAGGTWVSEIVVGSNYIGVTDIAVDALNRVHISYYDWLKGDLKYARSY
ncbi:MAG: carboxypeptidase regulatory-like domain-containing protein [Nitrospirae bacterium]|nr:carboxypeptidase regulatory-like domain-containing protein [Nitrospirota bacterium]